MHFDGQLRVTKNQAALRDFFKARTLVATADAVAATALHRLHNIT